MATKTLIIQSNVYNLLKMQHERQISLLNFEDYVLGIIGHYHAMMEKIPEQNRLNKLLAELPSYQRYDGYFYRNYKYVDVETNTQWLLDATTLQVNEALAFGLGDMTNAHYTPSKFIAFVLDILNEIEIKPDINAKRFSLSFVYAKTLLTLQKNSKLIDFEEIFIKAHKQKRIISLMLMFIIGFTITFVTASFTSFLVIAPILFDVAVLSKLIYTIKSKPRLYPNTIDLKAIKLYAVDKQQDEIITLNHVKLNTTTATKIDFNFDNLTICDNLSKMKNTIYF